MKQTELNEGMEPTYYFGKYFHHISSKQLTLNQDLNNSTKLKKILLLENLKRLEFQIVGGKPQRIRVLKKLIVI